MNGGNADKDILEALLGTEVSVVAGSILGDSMVKPLDSKGAQQVLDRLRGRGYKVTKV
jgi:hypothetical protein